MMYVLCFMPDVYLLLFLRNRDAKEVPGDQEGSHVGGHIYVCWKGHFPGYNTRITALPLSCHDGKDFFLVIYFVKSSSCLVFFPSWLVVQAKPKEVHGKTGLW